MQLVLPRRPSRARRSGVSRLLGGPAVGLLAILTLILAACGGGTAPSGSEPPPATGSSPARVVEHKYGETEVPADPQRIVTLGLSDQDAVLALGKKPVGAVDWFGERPFGQWPWVQPLWGDNPPTIVGERDEYNVEQIAALRPDLIIAQYSGMSQAQYDTLSEIAPVVAQPRGYPDYQAPWQVMTRAIGKAMGQEDKANDLIDGIAERFAAIRAEHPEFAGMTAVVADTPDSGQYSVFSPNDPKMVFLAEMGFTMPEQLKQFIGSQDVASLSAERLDLLEADRLVWLLDDPAAEERITANPLYQRLDVAAEDRDIFVNYTDPPIGAALSFNTVLSIPYATEQLVPLLASPQQE